MFRARTICHDPSRPRRSQHDLSPAEPSLRQRRISPQPIGGPMLEHTMTLWQDAKFAVRLLLKSPGFTAAAVLTLALGIATNTAVFTWFKAAYLDPIPGAHNPQQLVFLSGATGKGGGGMSNSY